MTKEQQRQRRDSTAGREALRGKVREAILEVAPDLDVEVLEPATDLRSEIGLDSIDLLNIAAAIQEKTGFEIPEAAISGLETVGDLIGFVAARSEAET